MQRDTKPLTQTHASENQVADEHTRTLRVGNVLQLRKQQLLEERRGLGRDGGVCQPHAQLVHRVAGLSPGHDQGRAQQQCTKDGGQGGAAGPASATLQAHDKRESTLHRAELLQHDEQQRMLFQEEYQMHADQMRL